MKVTYFTNLITEEGPGLLYNQIRQALEEAGVLYKYKHFPTENRMEFDKKATRELEKCDLLICGLGESLSVLRKAKKMGIKTLGLNFSTGTAYRERIFDDIFTRFGINIHDPLSHRVLKAEKIVDYFLVLSEFCKYTYVLHGVSPDKVFVVHPGVDTKQFSYAEQNSDYFKVLFVGTNPIRKGLPYLLKAWNQLEIKGKLVNRSGIISSMDNVISMPRWTTHDDMVDLYHSCSLTILPSLEEGFAGTNLESMSSGRPVITTNVTGLEDVMTDHKEGILIPPGDTKAIKDAILYYYENCEELIRQGKEARKLAEKYTWDLFRENVAITIKKLL